MKEVFNYLKGKKTYGLGFIGVMVLGAEVVGWIDLETTLKLLGLLSMGGLITLRMAVQDILKSK